ncbi:hypothetical protein [Bacillus litorisediminis]|uniref:hypothetical protein n=1 Tax=Bacillus litorisediminis TaxID=2922713 RepID=UPI001FAB9DC2|nr:hypothetical protein [Bacillus litorisediminis]
MSYKRFTMTVLGIVLVLTISFASFIYYIDPMWTFGHANKYNDRQTVINEREQKTSEIYFQPFEYDTLLIGSSRSTYINPHDFVGMDVYNYAVSNMSIREYWSFVEFAKSQHGKEFENIIIGLDFFKSSTKESSAPHSLDNYVEKVTKPFYRWKYLLSFDVFKYAVHNFKMSKDNVIEEERIYNRDNVAFAKVIDEETAKVDTIKKIDRFRSTFYGDNYVYYPQYKEIISKVRDSNPNSKIIVFTTPISTGLFKALVEEGQLDDYERWLTDLVEVYGGVYNFMYPNSITNDQSNYFDGHHFYPEIGTLIAHRLSGAEEDVPEDFGVYVTNENLQEHLEYVRGLAADF